MRNTFYIAWRETRAYFLTPTAYIVGAMFLVLTGIFFVFQVTSTRPEASVRSIIEWATFFMVFFAPLITMRLLAEEQKLGTLELLLTSPVSDWQVALGKYLASIIILYVTVSLTLYYVLLLYIFGSPDIGPVLTGYLGLLLYSAACGAIGLAASSLTSNQLIAAVVGVAVLLTLSFADSVGYTLSGVIKTILMWVCMDAHLNDFTKGVFDFSHIVYYFSVIGIFLFFTIKSLQSRRWR